MNDDHGKHVGLHTRMDILIFGENSLAPAVVVPRYLRESYLCLSLSLGVPEGKPMSYTTDERCGMQVSRVWIWVNEWPYTLIIHQARATQHHTNWHKLQ